MRTYRSFLLTGDQIFKVIIVDRWSGGECGNVDSSWCVQGKDYVSTGGPGQLVMALYFDVMWTIAL